MLSLFWDEVDKKESPTKRFSCEYCKISNNTCFKENLHTAASENNKKRFLGNATGCSDHYIIHMSSQRPKTGGN